MDRLPLLVVATLALVLAPPTLAQAAEPESVAFAAVLGDCELQAYATRGTHREGFVAYVHGTCVGLVDASCPVLCGRPVPFDVCRFGGEPAEGMTGRCDSGLAFSTSPVSPGAGAGAFDPHVAELRYGERAGPALVCYGDAGRLRPCTR